jgi:hypothetical protein
MKRRREGVDDSHRFRASRLSQPPKEWIEKGLRRIREEEALARESRLPEGTDEGIEGLRRFVREIRLVLTLDSMEGAVLAGIRGGSARDARQFLFESEAGKVHLQVRTGSKGKVDLTGLFLPARRETAPGGQAVLEHRKGRISRRLPMSGEFAFRGVGPGPYRLRLELGETLLITDPLDVVGSSDA